MAINEFDSTSENDRWERADDITNRFAEATRRFEIGANTGAIALVSSGAIGFFQKGVSPEWAVLPLSFFVAGLTFSAISLLIGKSKFIYLRRHNLTHDEWPRGIKAVFLANLMWDAMAMLSALFGAIIAIRSLLQIQA